MLFIWILKEGISWVPDICSSYLDLRNQSSGIPRDSGSLGGPRPWEPPSGELHTEGYQYHKKAQKLLESFVVFPSIHIPNLIGCVFSKWIQCKNLLWYTNILLFSRRKGEAYLGVLKATRKFWQSSNNRQIWMQQGCKTLEGNFFFYHMDLIHFARLLRFNVSVSKIDFKCKKLQRSLVCLICVCKVTENILSLKLPVMHI